MQVIKKLPHKHLLIYCLAALIPLMVMGLLFNVPLASNGNFFPGTNMRILGFVVQAEFLAAASGIVPLIPLLITIKKKAFRYLPRVLFIVLGYLCAWVAFTVAGTTGMLFYALLVFVTFGGGTLFIFDWLDGVTRTFLTMLRWSVALCAYITLQVQMGLDADIDVWKNSRDAVAFGASYFYLLCLFELLIYPPLIWHLEYRLRDEQRYSVALDGFGRALE